MIVYTATTGIKTAEIKYRTVPRLTGSRYVITGPQWSLEKSILNFSRNRYWRRKILPQKHF